MSVPVFPRPVLPPVDVPTMLRPDGRVDERGTRARLRAAERAQLREYALDWYREAFGEFPRDDGALWRAVARGIAARGEASSAS